MIRTFKFICNECNRTSCTYIVELDTHCEECHDEHFNTPDGPDVCPQDSPYEICITPKWKKVSE